MELDNKNMKKQDNFWMKSIKKDMKRKGMTALLEKWGWDCGCLGVEKAWNRQTLSEHDGKKRFDSRSL
jgi:hypothetical protein